MGTRDEGRGNGGQAARSTMSYDSALGWVRILRGRELMAAIDFSLSTFSVSREKVGQMPRGSIQVCIPTEDRGNEGMVNAAFLSLRGAERRGNLLNPSAFG